MFCPVALFFTRVPKSLLKRMLIGTGFPCSMAELNGQSEERIWFLSLRTTLANISLTADIE